jgi:hypothetical protein
MGHLTLLDRIVGLEIAAIFVTSLYGGIAVAQSPPPAPAPSSCEIQVSDQYRQLSAAGLVVQGTALQWGPQLTAIVKQVRLSRTQYEINDQRAKMAEQNIAQLLDQLREMQEQNAALKAELEQQKAATAVPAPPAN